MGLGKVVVLFVLGLLLASIAFPVAFFISIAFGYALCLISIVIGIYVAVKIKIRTLALVLGVLLIIVGSVIFSGVLFMHLTLYTASKVVGEVAKTNYVNATLGVPVSGDDWRITITDLREATYVKINDNYYKAKNNTKIVVVSVRVENTGRKIKSTSEIWDFTLVSNANNSYSRVYSYELEWIFTPSDDVKTKAIPVNDLDPFQNLAPGISIKRDIKFMIPIEEKPIKLYFKVGVVGPYEVEVKLQP